MPSRGRGYIDCLLIARYLLLKCLFQEALLMNQKLKAMLAEAGASEQPQRDCLLAVLCLLACCACCARYVVRVCV